MELIDTHTHLETFHRRGELAGVLERAAIAGVTRMITIGTSTDDWDLYREISAGHRGVVHYTAGLHPCSVDERWAEQISSLAEQWRAEHAPIGLGECGLRGVEPPWLPPWQRAGGEWAYPPNLLADP